MNIQFVPDILEWVASRTWVDLVHGHRPVVLHYQGRYKVPDGGADRLLELDGITRIIGSALCHIPRPTGKTAGGGGGGQRRRLASAETARQHMAPQLVYQPEEAQITRRAPLMMLRGFERGTLIHKQIEDLVLHDAAAFQRCHPHGLHPWAAASLRRLLALGRRPFRSEFFVSWPSLGMATKVDLVAVDQAGVIEFIELKTGYGRGAWTKSPPDAYWKVPALHGLPCSPRIRACVQATMGALMAVHMLRLPEGSYRAAILHIDEEEVVYEPIAPTFIAQQGVAIFEYLQALRQA